VGHEGTNPTNGNDFGLSHFGQATIFLTD